MVYAVLIASNTGNEILGFSLLLLSASLFEGPQSPPHVVRSSMYQDTAPPPGRIIRIQSLAGMSHPALTIGRRATSRNPKRS